MYSIPYCSITDVELNLAVGKINFVLPNFNPTILAFKNSKCLYFNTEACFELHKYYNMSFYKFSRSINSIKVPANLAYESFVAKCAWLSEAR